MLALTRLAATAAACAPRGQLRTITVIVGGDLKGKSAAEALTVFTEKVEAEGVRVYLETHRYRLKPWKIRQNNDSAKRYYTQKKAVQKEFEDLLLDENTGGF